MCVRCKELCADAKVCTHALCVNILKHNVTVEFEGGGKHIGGGNVFSVNVFDLQENGPKGIKGKFRPWI
jgi:hypothetical protein